MKILRLGTRKSALARAQAEWVARQLRETFPELRVELTLITTSGDRRTSKIPKGGLKALFTKEIEDALLDHRIDLAVHSLKDMAADLPKGLVIGAVPVREDPRDVWISKAQLPFKQLPAGASIGTGAVRRQAQLRRLLPKAKVVPIRGNVDTRLKQLKEGTLDGLVLALAGLKRLGRESAATESFPIKVMIPAVGQGCLGIQVREKDILLTPYLNRLDDPESHAAAKAERAFLKALGGTCQTPIAGHARIISEKLQMVGLVISPDGSHELRETVSGPRKEAESLGQTLAKQLLAAGAGEAAVMIEVSQLTKTFRVAQKEPGLTGAIKGLFSQRTRDVHAVQNISFTVKEGELVGFLGPNGAGKTTTLKMLSGLLHPTSGEATVLGHIPWKRARDFQMQFTMVMGQRTQLWWDLPAWDSFLLNKEIYEIPKVQFDETVEELSRLLEIQDILSTRVKKLSLGQRMKAELACSLLHRPRVLLLDEPTIGLDVLMQQKVRQFILEYNKRYKATILLTSHNMEDISELCTRLILINHGQILFDGPIADFEAQHHQKTLTEAMRLAFAATAVPHPAGH